MKVLVIGSGGREHTLVWKISQSPRVSEIYCAPGNGGIASVATCVPLAVDDLQGILSFCINNRVDLVVIGPEYPLTLGLADLLRKKQIPVIGPNKDAAQMEASKVFAKTVMDTCNVPTAGYHIFDDAEAAIDYCKKLEYPAVIKADGLAAGKGVILPENPDEAISAIQQIMVKKIFKDAGDKVLIEEFLPGEEASILAFVDGKDYIPMVSSQDHKKAFNKDRGPNTGGMGAYSPAPVITDELFEKIQKSVLEPVVNGLHKQGIYYQGILYAGIMVTNQGLKVLEFNVRFGDPETQIVLPRLKSDIIDIFEAQVTHTLSKVKPEWDTRSSLCVVMASGGYPGEYVKGKIITGLPDANALEDVMVFHAGTTSENGNIVTSGGRVLGVTALGNDIGQAYSKAYEAVEKIHFKNVHYRTDIGYKALARET